MKEITTKQFIEKAKTIHGDKYIYDKVEYVNMHTKVCIICPIHGEFWQTPDHHLRGRGCKICGIISSKPKVLTTEQFVERARKTHNNKYDYSKAEYKGCTEKICIICPIHGEFWQKASNHLYGQGCPKCVGLNKTTEEFISEAAQIHNSKYDYSKTEYYGNKKEVCIICPKHGEFWQTPHNHLKGQGCPICKESTLEKDIRLLLEEKDIEYLYQWHLPWAKYYSLDFYLPKQKIGIECQGRQHFECDAFFGGSNGFLDQLKRDRQKAEECSKHDIKILYYTKPQFKALYEVITNKDVLLKTILNENITQRRKRL